MFPLLPCLISASNCCSRSDLYKLLFASQASDGSSGVPVL